MSNIKALDKLREYAEGIVFEPGYKAGMTFDLNRIADAIEAEIAERYIELPVDADGVPIHVGDALEGAPGSKWDGERFKVGGMELTACGWEVADDGTCDSIRAGQTRHVKYLTIEDVLREFADEVQRCCDTTDTISEYADEIRELLGGSE